MIDEQPHRLETADATTCDSGPAYRRRNPTETDAPIVGAATPPSF